MNTRIDCLAAMDTLPPMHIKYLESLKAAGFEPSVIYDIGACVLHWTRHARRLWPNARIIVFDGNTDLEYLYQREGLDYFVGVLSDADNKVVRFYKHNEHISGNSYYRECGTSEFPPDKYIECHTFALDSVVKSKNFPVPDLVKIDVQGCEKDIIGGGLETLRNAQHLIVELQHTVYNEGAPLASDTMPYIEDLGWKCVAPLFCNNGPDGDYGFIKV